uniref:Seizure related 6 homolog a n=1 Tax=Eptatretus burgeri TaxID=7764 RepID=A0A8C4QC07_EPTBU
GLGPGSKVTALANQTLLVEGQVVRSFTNQMLVRFRSRRPHHHGSFRFHFQEYRLHCPFPARPTHGRVRVRDPSVGGRALYSCQPGYVLPDGNQYATCLNGTQPAWSQPLPQCHAPCGGIFSTATGGRILSPGYPDGYNGNLSCIWFLTAPPGQRLHVHFERVSLAEDDDRLIISDGSMPTSPLLYDSFRAEFPPGEGLTSSAHSLTIQLYTDGTGNAAGFALRYESFGPGHCYEPYIRFGRFQASDPAFSVGSMVSFSCDPGYSLDQGPSLLYCQDGRGPTWNDTEPLCRALCGGEVTDTEGLVLSPHWPEMYDEGQDCVWGVHAAQGTYLDLVVRASDMLTIYDGEDLSAPVLAQLSGQYHGVHLTSSQPDITLQFQSDPSPHDLGLGFRISFTERMRNDSCPDLPKVSNGWRTPSGNRLPYGASVSYHCYPSYDIEGPEIISCLWDLSWSEPPPSCQKALYCSDPGNVVNAERHVSDPDFPLGSTVRYICASGQILVGSSRLTCRGRVSGPQWSSPPPHCQAVSRACPDPGFPHGGSRHPQEVQRFRGNDIVYFACPVGFHLIGPSILSCLSSYPPSWNGTLPNCKGIPPVRKLHSQSTRYSCSFGIVHFQRMLY